MKMYSWKLKDIIMVGIISVLFAVIYLGNVYLAIALTTALTPFGLAPLGNEFVFGVWFMAATFAAYIIRKPGVAIVTEMLAAFIEVLMGNMYGPLVFVSGFIQGVGAEAGFFAFKYKKFNWAAMLIASAGSTVLSFIWGFFRSGFFNLPVWLLLVMFAIRLASAFIFSAVIAKILADRLAKTGVLKSYPIGEKYAVDVSE
jgi:energy-coupling factor transport system substrate-specific component